MPGHGAQMKGRWLPVVCALLLPAFAGCAGVGTVAPVVVQSQGLELRILGIPVQDGWTADIEVHYAAPPGQVAYGHGPCGSPLLVSVELADKQRADLLEGCGEAPSGWQELSGSRWRHRVSWNGRLRGHLVEPGVHRIRITADVLLRPEGDLGTHSGRPSVAHEVEVESTRDPGGPALTIAVERDPEALAKGTFVVANHGAGWAYFHGGGCVDPISYVVRDGQGRDMPLHPRIRACTADIRVSYLAPGEAWRSGFDWDGTACADDSETGCRRQRVPAGRYELVGTVRWQDAYGPGGQASSASTTVTVDVA